MGNHGIQVSCRVRESNDEGAETCRPCISIGDDARTILVHPNGVVDEKNNGRISTSTSSLAPGSSAYSCFDSVFSGQATQETVFKRIGRPMVDDFLQGYNCTILAYGQTGSGKTFTTVGNGDGESRGLIPRAIEAVFEELQRIDGSKFDVALTASFIEVYQENLRDLLLPHNSKHLKIREDKDGDVFVDGASAIQISSVASGLAILARGMAQRATGATLMNTESSRSHSVFTLAFMKRNRAMHVKLSGKLLLVDLAGSEKTRKMGDSGKRLDEAKHINRSSLGGNAKTHLLLTCSSSYTRMDETLSTLRFGARAKSILNTPHVNNEKTTSGIEYKELLTTLREKIESLYRYIQQLENRKCEQYLPTSHHASNISTGGSPEKRDGHAQPCEGDDPAGNDAETPRAHSPPSASASHLSDDIMQEEINSLRRTIVEMQCDRHEFEHARLVANTLIDVRKTEGDALHHHRIAQLQQQQADLDDADVKIGQLESQVARLRDENTTLKSSSSHLRQEMSRLQLQLKQWEEGQNAEAEILRRRLEFAERQAQRAQLELLASQQLQEELRASLTVKEQETRQLRDENDSLHSKLVSSVTTATAQHASTRFAHSPTQMGRPATAIEVASNLLRDLGTPSSNGMINIQSWWSGLPSDPPQQSPGDQQREEPSGLHPLPPSLQLPERRCASAATFVDEGAAAACSRQMALDERQCRSQCQAHRPFRARLVGLLNSLEEEANSLREMIDTGIRDHLQPQQQPRPVAAKAGRTRMQLPCLETISS
ncbi:Kinesin-like protein, partial [Globisporangium splendens]